jgi:hypothetical protein
MLGHCVFLALLIVLPPLLVLPRVVKQVPDPSGRYVAEIVITDPSTNPICKFLTMFYGTDVSVLAQIRPLDSRQPVDWAVLASVSPEMYSVLPSTRSREAPQLSARVQDRLTQHRAPIVHHIPLDGLDKSVTTASVKRDERLRPFRRVARYLGESPFLNASLYPFEESRSDPLALELRRDCELTEYGHVAPAVPGTLFSSSSHTPSDGSDQSITLHRKPALSLGTSTTSRRFILMARKETHSGLCKRSVRAMEERRQLGNGIVVLQKSHFDRLARLVHIASPILPRLRVRRLDTVLREDHRCVVGKDSFTSGEPLS